MPKNIVIEVCERLGDHRLVPKRDDKGHIVVERDFVPHVQAPKYHAQIKDKPGIWAAGNSRDEAIGDLIRCHPEEFGITIEALGPLFR